ncbi:MAG: HEAT repeat domain-containing protein, partial [Desulfamplus sp.]|nr:HEAT repeat domain-containing protein [Desulfamplus sp.]
MLEPEKMDIQKLKQMLHESNHENVHAAITALAQMRDEKTLSGMVDLLRSEQPQIRSYAVEIISRTGSFSLAHVQPLLNDNDPDIRKIAVEILRNIRLPVVEDILVQAMFNDDVNVSVAAVEALGGIGSYKAIPHLIEALEKEPWVKCAALKSLGEIASIKNRIKTESPGKENDNIHNSKEAVNIENSGKTESIRNQADSDSLKNRIEAASNAALDAVLKINPDNEDNVVLFCAIQSLEKMKRVRSIDFLVRILEKNQPPLFIPLVAAFASILQHADEKSIELAKEKIPPEKLIALLQNKNRTILNHTVQLLGLFRNKSAVNVLAALFSEANEHLFDTLEEAFLRIAPDDMSPLLTILDNPESSLSIKLTIVQLVGKLQDTEYLPVMLPYLEKEDDELRVAVLDNIEKLLYLHNCQYKDTSCVHKGKSAQVDKEASVSFYDEESLNVLYGLKKDPSSQ